MHDQLLNLLTCSPEHHQGAMDAPTNMIYHCRYCRRLSQTLPTSLKGEVKDVRRWTLEAASKQKAKAKLSGNNTDTSPDISLLLFMTYLEIVFVKSRTVAQLLLLKS